MGCSGMSRIIRRDCWFCGKAFGYMASGYGVDPVAWNQTRGVGFHYCSQCAHKVTPLHEKMWVLRDEIEGNILVLEMIVRDTDRWLSWVRIGDSLKSRARRVFPSLIKAKLVSVDPMRIPHGPGVLFGFPEDGAD